MSDELKNKSGKVKVMYVRSDDDSDKRTQNPRTGKGGGRPASSRADGGRRPARDDRNTRGDDRKRDDRKRDDRPRSDRPRSDRPRDDRPGGGSEPDNWHKRYS